MELNYIIIALIGLVILIILILIMRNKAPQQQYLPTGQMAMVSEDLYQSVKAQNEVLQKQLAEKEIEIRKWMSAVATAQQEAVFLKQKIAENEAQSSDLQQQLTLQFEQIANRMLEAKGNALSVQQNQQLGHLLQPLQIKLREFQQDLNQKFLEESKEKVSLRKEIEQLRDLNVQLSSDAINLTSALKGQSKVQGDWGEYQLELILEKAGLLKGIHFFAQLSLLDDDGHQKRPDFIIQLPDQKHLIIDSKVSLTAFERYHNAQDPEERKMHLKAHIDSMRKHVDQLSKKNYTQLHQITSPDYLLLFVPLEGAFSSAAHADPELFTDALERNIVLVTSTSLVATMRTVSHIWKQEKQARSVQEIARQSGLLYDKFVGFVDDLKTVGQRLDSAQSAWHDAYNKLSNSSKFGDTLVGRAEKIRALGARNSKMLSPELTQQDEENEIV
jgi:DNA recombination protein RmuC